MMKRFLLLCVLMTAAFAGFAQTRQFYDPALDPMAQIDSAVQVAKQQDKYVLCQVGGNWCKWCRMFASFVEDDAELSQLIRDNYVYIHVNYGQKDEPKTQSVIRRLKNPGRFGFPVLVLLDQDGQVIHTQATNYLEEGQGYNRDRVMEFFRLWTPKAVNTVVR